MDEQILLEFLESDIAFLSSLNCHAKPVSPTKEAIDKQSYRYTIAAVEECNFLYWQPVIQAR